MLDREVAVRILLSALLTSSVHLSAVFYLQENQKNANAIVDTNYPESILPSKTGPNLTDSNLQAEVVFSRLTYPTDMAFLGKNDILVIEKDTGIVKRIVNGTMLQKPLLDVNVATFGHRGMLGITTSNMTSLDYQSTSSMDCSGAVMSVDTIKCEITNTYIEDIAGNK